MSKINFENINTPWYRKDENFPCLICGKFSKINNWNDEDYQESKFEWCLFVVESQELLFQLYNHDETENFRLATKEECLSLFREVK